MTRSSLTYRGSMPLTRTSPRTPAAAAARPWRALALVASLGALGLAGCGDGGDEDGAGAGGGPKVVATTTQAADFAREVGGGRVELTRLLAPGADPHDYEPRPSDARALAEADLVLRSGGEVDGWLGDLLDGAGGGAREVTLIDSVRTVEGGGGDGHGDEDEDAGEGGPGDEVDPHWWQDPRNARAAALRIRDALSEADPAGRRVYEANAARYAERLRRLDAQVAECIRRVPPARRKLVTTHDALGYFARRYGLDVVGALIPSLSSRAQPSAGQTARLVEQVRREGVQAIFPESSLSPKLERAVARETGARVGRALWADSLGPPGSGGATYLESIAWNARAIAEGLTGGRVRCEIAP